MEDTEGATGILLGKRVINLRKTNPQVLTWAISRMAHRLNEADPDRENPVDPENLIAKTMKVLGKVMEFEAKIKAIKQAVKIA